MVWIWNVTPLAYALTMCSPDSHSLKRGCGTFQRWGLVDRCGWWGRCFKVYLVPGFWLALYFLSVGPQTQTSSAPWTECSTMLSLLKLWSHNHVRTLQCRSNWDILLSSDQRLQGILANQNKTRKSTRTGKSKSGSQRAQTEQVSFLEINSGSQRKRPSFQLKYLKVDFTLDQEVALRRVITNSRAWALMQACPQTDRKCTWQGWGLRCGGCGDLCPFPIGRSQTS